MVFMDKSNSLVSRSLSKLLVFHFNTVLLILWVLSPIFWITNRLSNFLAKNRKRLVYDHPNEFYHFFFQFYLARVLLLKILLEFHQLFCKIELDFHQPFGKIRPDFHKLLALPPIIRDRRISCSKGL